MTMHPNEALFGGEKSFPIIPACEHFAGSEKLILKAFALQGTLGAVFDITCDCEDGAMAGQERAHAEMIVRLLNSEAKYGKNGWRAHSRLQSRCVAARCRYFGGWCRRGVALYHHSKNDPCQRTKRDDRLHSKCGAPARYHPQTSYSRAD